MPQLPRLSLERTPETLDHRGPFRVTASDDQVVFLTYGTRDHCREVIAYLRELQSHGPEVRDADARVLAWVLGANPAAEGPER